MTPWTALIVCVTGRVLESVALLLMKWSYRSLDMISCIRKIICFDGSYSQGIWWIRVFGYGLSLKAPWDKPLFSERNGYTKVIVKFKGWRVFWLRKAVA